VNILISGATGYLGSNILAYFDRSLHNISILDRGYSILNKQDGYDIFLYLSNPNEIDFNKDSDKSARSMTEHYFSIQRILEGLSINFIMYASTVRVHDRKKNIYAKTHLLIESQIKKYTSENGILLSIARFGNIFGGTIESMVKRHTLVPHVFIKNAIEKGEIILKTNGNQSRDFTPMSMVNKYISYILENKPLVIDVCTGHNIKVIDVVRILNNFFQDININLSTDTIEENITQYSSILKIEKRTIEGEIINTASKWKEYYDSNSY
jgi:nucleoside-diphosphate-sugar epimerase